MPEQRELKGQIIIIIKTLTQNFRKSLPESLKPIYHELI